MYAKGMTTRQISETIEDIYGFETSEGFISDVTDKILPQIEDWICGKCFPVFIRDIFEGVPHLMNDTSLIFRLRKCCRNRFFDAGKPIRSPYHQHWRERKLKVLALCFEWIKKSWCKRYPDHLCRWAYRHQRSDCGSIS